MWKGLGVTCKGLGVRTHEQGFAVGEVGVGMGGGGVAFHHLPPPRVRAGTARGRLPAALRVPARGALRPPEGPLPLPARVDGREV